jgi:hypothetical protein
VPHLRCACNQQEAIPVGTATTNVTWIFISPAEHCRRHSHRHIKPVIPSNPEHLLPPKPWPSLKPHSDLGRAHPCEDVYANYVLMAKSRHTSWTVSDLLLRLLATSDVSALPHSNIYMTERTGFLTRLHHHMNLPFNVRIGNTLLHLKRVLVYIALQGALASLMRNLIMQHNDSVTVMLSTPRYFIRGFLSNSCYWLTHTIY